jgi:hypothetical protein
LGTFVNRDPIRYEAGDVNLYRYVGNSPHNKMDPDGQLAIGHHYFPVAVLRDLFEEGLITEGAWYLGLGYYTGQTEPDHGYREYGGVTHARYNELVEDEFRDLGHTRRNPMTADEMLDFIEKKIRKSDKAEITDFLDVVEAQRRRFLKRPAAARPPRTQSVSQLINRGNNFVKSRSYATVRVLGALTGVGLAVVSESTGFAQTCAVPNGPYQKSLEALNDGDLSKGLDYLLGSRRDANVEGLYDLLVTEGYPKAALKLEIALDRLQTKIREEKY